MVTAILRKLFSGSRGTKSVKSKFERRPFLEILEDRFAPAKFAVANLNNAGNGSLREAIINLNNSNDAANTITFNQGVTGGINLETALQAINKNVTITGPGSQLLTVQRSAAQGTPEFRIFQINADVTVTITGLTVAGGIVGNGIGGGILNNGSLTLNGVRIMGSIAAQGGGIYNEGILNLQTTLLQSNSANDGAGIYNYGALTFTNLTLVSNLATRIAAGRGGGIFNSGSMTGEILMAQGNSALAGGGGLFNSGTFTVSVATFANNNAGPPGLPGGQPANVHGGGIYNTGAISLARSTLNTNRASMNGGAIYNAGNAVLETVTGSGNQATNGAGIYNTNTSNSTSNRSTISFNQNMPLPGGMNVAAVFLENGAVATFYNTIVARNMGSPTPDVFGVIQSLGNNLFGIGAGATGFAPTDLVGTFSNPIDPRLSPLGNYGGPTQTHILMAGSPARDAGNNASAPATDQRGFARIVGPAIDIGAVEMQVGEGAGAPNSMSAPSDSGSAFWFDEDYIAIGDAIAGSKSSDDFSLAEFLAAGLI